MDVTKHFSKREAQNSDPLIQLKFELNPKISQDQLLCCHVPF